MTQQPETPSSSAAHAMTSCAAHAVRAAKVRMFPGAPRMVREPQKGSAHLKAICGHLDGYFFGYLLVLCCFMLLLFYFNLVCCCWFMLVFMLVHQDSRCPVSAAGAKSCGCHTVPPCACSPWPRLLRSSWAIIENGSICCCLGPQLLNFCLGEHLNFRLRRLIRAVGSAVRRSGTAWCALGSFGGGFLGGDEVDVSVEVGQDSMLGLSTQDRLGDGSHFHNC